MNVSGRITYIIQEKNKLIFADVLIQLGMGLLFSFLIYGFLFMLFLMISIVMFTNFLGPNGINLGLPPLYLAMLGVAIFYAVATWSAYSRVDPFRGMKKLTDKQMMLTIISQASSKMLYFSPKHASAAFATFLLSGPLNFFTAWGTWKNRLVVDDEVIDDAAEILEKTRKAKSGLPVKKIKYPEAAFLLKQLNLISIAKAYEGQVVKLSEKGFKLFAGKHR